MRQNPLYAIGLGLVLLAISFLVGGATRDLILRIAGVVFLVAGAVMWFRTRAR